MKYVEIVAEARSANTIMTLAKNVKAYDVRLGVVDEFGMQQMRLLVADSRLQKVLDTLQNILGAHPSARILVMPVEASLPAPEKDETEEKTPATAAREALYAGVSKNANLDVNYVVLVLLSTVVAAIGLIENNIAVVIGAMVIAPLLGPNLALGLGTVLGDVPLMRKSVVTNIAGVGLAVVLSVIIGIAWPADFTSPELMSRTEAGFGSIALALASGAAAALSLTTGLSSVLVGVMVAVALLPPAATMGIMIGDGQMELAAGAALLLAINIVCVNLATNIVFFAKGISPRAWLEKQNAKRAMTIIAAVWSVTLVVLMLIIYLRQTIAG